MPGDVHRFRNGLLRNRGVIEFAVAVLPVVIPLDFQAIAHGVIGVVGLIERIAPAPELVHFDQLVALVVIVMGRFVVRILPADFIAVGIVGIGRRVAGEILHLGDMVFSVIPVVYLRAVRVADADLIACRIVGILNYHSVMIGNLGDPVQQIHGDGGLTVPVVHLDQIAGAVIQEGHGLAAVIVDLAHQIDGAVRILGDIAVLVCLLD